MSGNDLQKISINSKVYSICEERLGKGSFASVYKVYDEEGKYFALKEIEISAERQRLYQNEIDIMKTLSHKNIVQYYGHKTIRNTLYILMEFCTEGTLKLYLERVKKVPEITAKKIMRQVVSGMEYLDSKNISHRDLKPDNILLTKTGKMTTVKIADFGLSKQRSDAEELMSTIVGTKLYQAPECVPGSRHFSPSYTSISDIWSLGAILYEMLFGCSLIPPNVIEHHRMIQSPDAIVIPFAEKLTPQCRELLSRMLEKDPKKRITWRQLFEHPWINSKKNPTTASTIPHQSSSSSSSSSSSNMGGDTHSNNPMNSSGGSRLIANNPSYNPSALNNNNNSSNSMNNTISNTSISNNSLNFTIYNNYLSSSSENNNNNSNNNNNNSNNNNNNNSNNNININTSNNSSNSLLNSNLQKSTSIDTSKSSFEPSNPSFNFSYLNNVSGSFHNSSGSYNSGSYYNYNNYNNSSNHSFGNKGSNTSITSAPISIPGKPTSNPSINLSSESPTANFMKFSPGGSFSKILRPPSLSPFISPPSQTERTFPVPNISRSQDELLRRLKEIAMIADEYYYLSQYGKSLSLYLKISKLIVNNLNLSANASFKQFTKDMEENLEFLKAHASPEGNANKLIFDYFIATTQSALTNYYCAKSSDSSYPFLNTTLLEYLISECNDNDREVLITLKNRLNNFANHPKIF